MIGHSDPAYEKIEMVLCFVVMTCMMAITVL